MHFDITFGNLINIFMIAAGIGISGLSIVQISKAPISKVVRKYFIFFLWMIIGYTTMHLTRQMLEGNAGTGYSVAIRIVTFIEFLISGLMAFMLSQMILHSTSPDKNQKVISTVFFALLAIHSVMLIISQFTDIYYYYDSSNVYHRSKLYIVSNITPIIMMVQDIYLLIRYRKKLERHVAKAYWIYMIAPLVAIVLQAIYSEVQFVIFATVGAAVYMFAVITRDLTVKYAKQQIDASRIDAELSMATRIQSDMLPSIFPAFPERREFDIYASMDPAKEVGGDFYDFFLVDDDHLCMVMADVSGKGVPAALFMMASKIIIANNAMAGKSPAQILTDTNDAVCSNNREEMFVTVWLGILEISSGKLVAANAGHEYPAVKQPDGEFVCLKDKHGFVIGGMSGYKYKEYELALKKGSKLFLYTDGVPEATDADGKMFGTENMLSVLNKDDNASSEQIVQSMRESVDAFVGSAEQFDDLTMLCFEYNGEE